MSNHVKNLQEAALFQPWSMEVNLTTVSKWSRESGNRMKSVIFHPGFCEIWVRRTQLGKGVRMN